MLRMPSHTAVTCAALCQVWFRALESHNAFRHEHRRRPLQLLHKAFVAAWSLPPPVAANQRRNHHSPRLPLLACHCAARRAAWTWIRCSGAARPKTSCRRARQERSSPTAAESGDCSAPFDAHVASPRRCCSAGAATYGAPRQWQILGPASWTNGTIRQCRGLKESENNQSDELQRTGVSYDHHDARHAHRCLRVPARRFF